MDEDKENGDEHYGPQSIVNGLRIAVPSKVTHPPSWKLDCMNQSAPIWSLRTPSNIAFSLASSCFQGSARQGRVAETIQWGLEMIRTDAWIDYPELQNAQSMSTRKVGKGENNFWNRVIIICAEDISFGNPCMIVAASLLLDVQNTFKTQKEAELEAMTMMKNIASSRKSRVCDWACITRIDVPESNLPFSTSVYANRLYTCLTDPNQYHLVFGYTEGFISASLSDKARKTKVNDRLPVTEYDIYAKGIPLVKYYKNKRIIIWVVILKVMKILNDAAIQAGEPHKWFTTTRVVEACYKIALHENFRWGIPARLFGRMAAFAIMYRDQVEARGLNFEIDANNVDPAYNWTPKEQEQFRVRIRDGDLMYGIPDHCRDKHTKEGKQLGRNLKHFVEVKSRLCHESLAFKSLSDYYLQMAYLTRWPQEKFSQSTLRTIRNPEQYNNKTYVQQLRQEQDASGEFDDSVRRASKECVVMTLKLPVMKDRALELATYCHGQSMVVKQSSSSEISIQKLICLLAKTPEEAIISLSNFFPVLAEGLTGDTTIHYCLWENALEERQYGDVWFIPGTI
jgi:hypothetical protein